MKRILIAEDDFFIRDIYKQVFELGGYEVETAMDGDDALIKIKQHLFDIILLDIMMPKTNGIEVIRQTRILESANKATPIFLITNIGQQDIIEEAFKVGMDGYIIKSQVTPQQIVNEINTFLSNKEKAANPV